MSATIQVLHMARRALIPGDAPAPASIGVGLTPSSRTVAQGNSVQYTVPITRLNTEASVALAVTGLPAGVTGELSTASVVFPATFAALTVTAAGDATPVLGDEFLVTASASGVADATVIGTVTVTEPVAPTDPELNVLFNEDFEDANFSHVENGGEWTSRTRVSIVRDDQYVVHNGTSTVLTGPIAGREWENNPISAGDHAARFNYPAGQNQTEARFLLPGELPEVWVSFWWRIPINFAHPTGNNNQKLLALWQDAYEFGGDGATVVLQFRGVGSGHSKLTVYCVRTEIGDGLQRHSGEFTEEDIFIATPADRGRWAQIVHRVVASTSPETPNGIIQTWRRWEDETPFQQVFNITNMRSHPPAGYTGFRRGYIMGWANAPYASNTEFLMDDFQIANSGTGWGV